MVASLLRLSLLLSTKEIVKLLISKRRRGGGRQNRRNQKLLARISTSIKCPCSEEFAMQRRHTLEFDPQSYELFEPFLYHLSDIADIAKDKTAYCAREGRVAQRDVTLPPTSTCLKPCETKHLQVVVKLCTDLKFLQRRPEIMQVRDEKDPVPNGFTTDIYFFNSRWWSCSSSCNGLGGVIKED